ncbi:hypothetical protein [Rhodococcus sp. WMMA185]|uniref:hypothetical protein n=1 Tax=Rhodococcus sp. WMMA185 TaxID=679318 RepID=UPI001E44BC2B|nr:hypothetical protein [Rhodococcus sp. WMMA185]
MTGTRGDPGKKRPIWQKLLFGLATAFAVFAIIGLIVSPPMDDTGASAQRPDSTSDPRCKPADPALIDLVSSGLTKPNRSLTNATVIEDGALTFFGATVVDNAGSVQSRADVWVVFEGQVYSSTDRARNDTNWPRARESLGIQTSDSRVRAVDECVENLTGN